MRAWSSTHSGLMSRSRRVRASRSDPRTHPRYKDKWTCEDTDRKTHTPMHTHAHRHTPARTYTADIHIRTQNGGNVNIPSHIDTIIHPHPVIKFQPHLPPTNQPDERLYYTRVSKSFALGEQSDESDEEPNAIEGGV